MLMTRRFSRFIWILIAMALVPKPAMAQEEVEPSAKVLMETSSVAAGIGLSWGNGRLRFNGREYRFTIDGVTLVDFGISKASAVGEVYNLTDVAKFQGNYVAIEASFALGGGMGAISLRNPHGVFMRLNSATQGARLQLGSSGINIKLW
jgi:hypothetical protein